MDPNANLEEQLKLVHTITETLDRHEGLPADLVADTQRLLDLILGMDSWLRRGGFLPTAYQHASGAKIP